MNKPPNKLKILHTSDWHLGRMLYGQKRYEEFEQFFDFLFKTISDEQIDVLLVAGDIFDTNTPSNRSQEIYYRFLSKITSSSTCKNVIITAGNHDSPSFLNAPKNLLQSMNIFVIGSATENIEDEVILLKSQDNTPQLIVCAVPYLRDKDVRLTQEGESFEDKEQKTVAGIVEHYKKVVNIAEQINKNLTTPVPIIATGHFFTDGGKIVENDGVRKLYVGNLGYIPASLLPQNVDYWALGHLHIPQNVNNSETMRYSGSPLPMGFNESFHKKSFCIIELKNNTSKIKQIEIPIFQELKQIKGDTNHILSELEKLKMLNSNAWIEIIYEGNNIAGNLNEIFFNAISDSQLKILRIKNSRLIKNVLNKAQSNETLEELSKFDVFQRCLDANNIPQEQQTELIEAYQEIIKLINEEDSQSE